ncbi:MAG: DUF1569 domain-containing protein [Pseudarcicella sp.]|jgi:hypothetical protein|nr:DUF1569 domain-containing protein [Pseudarcicella sp.]MBP6411350.1 DUF1569 domain-containing protein [Pseudarcicella sp.]
MTLSNIFTEEVAQATINRINTLQKSTSANWGKMNAGQMLAHCNVTYEMVYEDKHPKPNFFLKFILKTFVKPTVVGPKAYPKSSSTAPQFIVKEEKDFDAEKKRLTDHILKTQQLGENHFHNKESHSFGMLTKDEWNNLFYKHLDHHLTQFGV